MKKLKMRKIKTALRAIKKDMSKKFSCKIKKCIFTRKQLLMIGDFLYNEQKRNKIKKLYSCNIIKVGDIAIGSFDKF